MDTIFHKTTSAFNVVSVARNEPHRYGKNGELLINYQDTEEHLRRASHVSEKHCAKSQFVAGSELESGKGVHREDQNDSVSDSS